MENVYTLMIAEDEENTRLALSDGALWARLGYRMVGAAANGAQALAMADQLRPRVLLTDIRMQPLDGLELVAYLCQRDWPMDFVLISGYSDFDYARQAISLGVFAYLTKPLEPRALQQTFSDLHKRIDREARPPQTLMTPALRDDYVTYLLRQRVSRAFFELECKTLQLRLKGEWYAVAALRPAPHGPDCLPALRNALAKAQAECIRTEDGAAAILAFQRPEELTELRRALRAALAPGGLLGVSPPLADPTLLHQCYDQAISALSREDAPLVSGVVAQAQAYIQAHVEEKLTLGDIAAAVHVTPTHLSHAFKRQSGQTLSAYVVACKVERARRLLASSGMGVQEIAYRLGFLEYRYFCVVFKRETGMTPLSYRQSLLRPEPDGKTGG